MQYALYMYVYLLQCTPPSPSQIDSKNSLSNGPNNGSTSTSREGVVSHETGSASLIPPPGNRKKMSAPGNMQPNVQVRQHWWNCVCFVINFPIHWIVMCV